MREIKDNWVDELIAFAKSHRKASSSTLGDYCRYIQNVAERLGSDIAGLVFDEHAYHQTERKIANVTEWSKSTKDDYLTAVKLLWEFRMSKEERFERASVSGNVDLNDFPWKIIQQINDVEARARECEYAVCKLVFGFLTAYTVALPALVLKSTSSIYHVFVGLIAVLVSAGGIYSFLPVLMRPARHWREIKQMGDDLLAGEGGSYYCNPEWWTPKEVSACWKTAIFFLVSILLLFAPFVLEQMSIGGSGTTTIQCQK